MKNNEYLETLAASISDATGCDEREYLRKMKRFRHLLARGIEPGAWMVIEHDLVNVAQVPSGANRRDLVAELEALEGIAECAEIVGLALERELVVEAIEDLGGIVRVEDDTTSTVTIVVEGERQWPEVLGGDKTAGELERRVVLHIKRAPWRDRKVRRLARLEVIGVEIHPDYEHSEL